MDLRLAAAFMRVIAENSVRYPVAMQQTLLEGIFQLADECNEELKGLPDPRCFDDLRVCLELVKDLSNDSFKNGSFTEGFRLAAECFPSEISAPGSNY